MGEKSKNVETRAAGRPPEEAQSDDAEEQAAVILEDSEQRVGEGIVRSSDNGIDSRAGARDNDAKSG